MSTPNGPVITGVHHVCLTVTDIDASMNWYQQLFQAQRWPGHLAHYAREETGFAEMLVEPNTGLLIGLHHHNANQGEKGEESRTGLDHISFEVADRAAIAVAAFTRSRKIQSRSTPIPLSIRRPTHKERSR